MKAKAYTNIYHPHYTGFDRFLICQSSLYVDKEQVINNLKRDNNHLAPTIAYIMVDDTLYIQNKFQNNNDKYHVGFLNLSDSLVLSKYRAAQTCLYTTYEESVETAHSICNSNYHTEFKDMVYSHIGVPVIFEKFPIDPLKTTVRHNEFRFENTMLEQRFFEFHR